MNDIDIDDKDVYGKMLGVDKDKIIIREVTGGAKVLEIIENIFSILFRFIVIVIVFALISLALTVLINETLRTFVFETIKSYF